ncbi:hypothetical protein [Anaeroselena agilis]|uniref:Uncharacterized protein n=1 Tax=Anaeroselena agilis TaxID=3063788 RepID=A0ABU3P2Q3_9FIRM|nr:hypothetical protein [Selenomonadales bacterium 4137-cl]
MGRWFCLAALAALLLTGCAPGAPAPSAGLTPQPKEALSAWEVPANLVEQGAGNSCRVVKGAYLSAEAALELAAGGRGELEYFREAPAGGLAGRGRLQFLSTQGTGRVKLTALDDNGRELGAVGWVFTGPPPPADGTTTWVNGRYTANYVGDWLAFDHDVAALFAAHRPEAARRAAKYRLSVVVGQGQHALVTALGLESAPARAVRVTPAAGSLSAVLGQAVTVAVDVENVSPRPLADVAVALVEPFGYGLTAADKRQVVASLAPGEKRRLTWQVRARRPDAVNFGRPWPVTFTVNGAAVPAKALVAVADPRPGRVFYVMTEDLEAIDSAGYAAAWGNADGWLQPEELTVQMVTKAERVNAIAEKYGARWTHYIAWPLVNAAEWAAGQSAAGEWRRAAAAIAQSVRSESARGHEYAIHLHSDYDPYLPGNVLSYNPAVDGLWANHLRHGWAHSLGSEGGYRDRSSRTGFLYAYQRRLDELEAGSPLGQLITARVGSFDFGDGEANEAMSTRVYRRVGLLAGSDADGNRGGVTAGDWGQAIYLAKPDDINAPASELKNTGLVEFRPTPREFIQYDSQSAAAMNAKADAGMAVYAAGGGIKPGVHAIVGFTHVMFVMGEGDWRSTTGGQFAALEGHLAYLKERYADKGLLAFATAGELVRAYLDYYAPAPVVLYGPRSKAGWLKSEFPLVILGRDIPIDAAHPHTVRVKCPLYLGEAALRVSVLKDGRPVYAAWGLPTPENDIVFTVDDRNAHYSLEIYHNDTAGRLLSFLRLAWSRLARG